ncbi:MAG: protein kinase [Verrucomicrobiales bacterium]|nr:protein kinase [Verrucomicrobiales bacterium]
MKRDLDPSDPPMDETAQFCSRCGAPLVASELGIHCARCLAAELLNSNAATDSERGLQVLRRLGDYELIQEIGRGGMGVVFRARQVSLDRWVAVKVPREAWLNSPDQLRRFRAEATSAARLRHPNIVAVHEIGEDQGQVFFAMDLVEGESLASLCDRGRLPWRRATQILHAVADAVQHAHERGILHRDLKPSNILLDSDQQPRITDFGIARSLDASNPMTFTGQVLGTPGYLAPEQAAKHGEVSPATDVYGLGSFLYHLLTGHAPFQAENPIEILKRVAEEEPLSPRSLNPEIPRDLEVVCLKCLAKSPSDRYPSAHALRDDLERLLAAKPVKARPVGFAGRWVRWARREPLLAGSLSLAAATLVCALIITTWQWRDAEKARQNEVRERHRAESALAIIELRRAEEQLEAGNLFAALHGLARVAREHPDHPAAGPRLLSFLAHRDLAFPVKDPIHPTSVINWLRQSHDGRRVVSASYSGSAQVWDLSTGQALGAAMTHASRVRYAEFSPNDELIVTASGDQTARIWSALTGQPHSTPLPHDAFVNAAHFSPDGSRVVTAADDHLARIWETSTGRLLWATPPERGNVVDARFSPDGQWLLSVARCPEGARLWKASTGDLLKTLPTPPTGCRSGAISGDGRLLALGTYHGSVLLVDRDAGETLAQFELRGVLGYVQCVEFSRTSSRLLAAGGNGVWVWNLDRPRSPALLIPMATQVTSAEFGASDDEILVSSLGVGARLFALKHTGTVPQEFPAPRVMAATLDQTGQHLLGVGGDSSAKRWDLSTHPTAPSNLQHPTHGRFLHPSPDRRSVMGSTDLGRALSCLWQTDPTFWTTNQARPDWVEFSPDGARVAEVHQERELILRQRSTGSPLGGTRLAPSPIHGLAFSPDGRQLVAACEDGSLRLWSIDGTSPAEIVMSHQKAAWGASFDREGRQLLSRSEDGTARLWDVQSAGALLATFSHDGTVQSCEFSPDEKKILTGSNDGTARLWSRATGLMIGEPMRHHNMVACARFSPDGLRIVTASVDGTARLWDATTTLPLTESLHHGGSVSDARFSADGRQVVTVTLNDRVRIWSLPPITQPAPSWLPDLADLIAGVPSPLDPSAEISLQTRIQSILAEAFNGPSGPYQDWAAPLVPSSTNQGP